MQAEAEVEEAGGACHAICDDELLAALQFKGAYGGKGGPTDPKGQKADRLNAAYKSAGAVADLLVQHAGTIGSYEVCSGLEPTVLAALLRDLWKNPQPEKSKVQALAAEAKAFGALLEPYASALAVLAGLCSSGVERVRVANVAAVLAHFVECKRRVQQGKQVRV
jgi:hypothetical protein